LSIVDFFNKCEYRRSIHIFPDLPHKHQSIICHRLLPLLLHCHRLLPLLLRYRQLLPLRLRHDYHYDDSDDHNDSSFYVRTRTADLTLLS
jgi:hypothetical protein